MPTDPRNRPDPGAQPDLSLRPAARQLTDADEPTDPRNRPSSESRPATADTSAAVGPARAIRSTGEDVPVQPRPTRPMLILHQRSLPAGSAPVPLAELADRLRLEAHGDVRVIGARTAPDALAAELTDDQIARLTAELGDRLRIVDDTPIDF